MIDDTIAAMTPVQKRMVAEAEHGFAVTQGRMKSYRRLRRLGLIEEPRRQIIAVLTDYGREVYEHLTGGQHGA